MYGLAREPLTRVRRGLAAETAGDQPWPLLPLMVCEAVCGHYEEALPAAAALQLLMAAADVFDDIEDADCPDSLKETQSSAVATNVATALLVLAEKSITRLEARGISDSMIVRVMDVVNSFYTRTCEGQHLDLSLNSMMPVSEDVYLRVAYMKSASTVECACHVGCLLAMANQSLMHIFAEFGRALGMASQIANDIRGITRGTDVVKRKITLPIVFALAQSDTEAHSKLEIAFDKSSEFLTDSKKTTNLLFSLGAIHYTAIRMEFYRQEALDMLAKAQDLGANVQHLKLLLG